MAPASVYFAQPTLRHRPDVLVYGPAHLFRSAWLAGVQDYLREPWAAEELFLRLRGSRSPVSWHWADLEFLLEGASLATAGASLPLTAAEAGVLRVLAQRQGTPVSRGVLAWAASCSDGRVVDTLVGRLRAKLRRASGRQDNPIPAVRGLGYRLP